MTPRAQKLRDILKTAQSEQPARLVVTGHDAPDVDSLASCMLFRALAAHWGVDVHIALPTRADEQARRVMPRFGIEPDAFLGDITASDALVLVDHHEPLHPGRVLACIDHHPTSCPPDFPYVQIEPAGSCAGMILNLSREADMPGCDAHTALAVTALYLDTIALRSSKIALEEIAWAREQVAALGMDEAWLRREGMNLHDMRAPARELAMLGRKVYRFSGKRVISSYVQTDAMTPHILDEILHVIREEVQKEGAALWVFLVHDPAAGYSTEYDVTPDGNVSQRHYDRLISRGKDIMPRVEREMAEKNSESLP